MSWDNIPMWLQIVTWAGIFVMGYASGCLRRMKSELKYLREVASVTQTINAHYRGILGLSEEDVPG